MSSLICSPFYKKQRNKRRKRKKLDSLKSSRVNFPNNSMDNCLILFYFSFESKWKIFLKKQKREFLFLFSLSHFHAECPLLQKGRTGASFQYIHCLFKSLPQLWTIVNTFVCVESMQNRKLCAKSTTSEALDLYISIASSCFNFLGSLRVYSNWMLKSSI